jgi:hypothetical protein
MVLLALRHGRQLQYLQDVAPSVIPPQMRHLTIIWPQILPGIGKASANEE